jgi:hypothetical protein
VEKDVENWITKAELYDHYVSLCEKLKEIPCANNWFSKEVRRFLPYTKEGWQSVEDIKTKVWRGIRVKTSQLNSDYGVEDNSSNASSTGKLGDETQSRLPLKEENAVDTVATVPNLRDKLDSILKWFHKREGKVDPSASINLVASALQLDYREAIELVNLLIREGQIFEPRPGVYKAT